MAKDSKTQLEQQIDPFGLMKTTETLMRAWFDQPQYLMERSQKLQQGIQEVSTHTWRRMLGGYSEDPEQPSHYDDRFSDETWRSVPFLDAAKEFYLCYSRWLMDTICDTPGMSKKERSKAAFWTRQWVDAISPSNFFLTNPQAMNRFVETNGKSLRQGMTHLVRDMANGDIPMTASEPFKVGENLANTPGKVVYRNRLFELIQYTPTTDKVRAMPLLIVPPWINKYYIMDLNPKKSLVRWLVAQGYTVFMMSWKNPTPEMRDVGMDDYLSEGLDEAQKVVREITGSKQIHAVGYCIGGILLMCYLAWMNRGRGKKENLPIAHWTGFTTLADFTDPGDIGVFVDEHTLDYIDKLMEEPGYLDGEKIAFSFRMLRPNNLIWQYVVSNYLLGEEPPAFDVLYWNSDNTRLPKAMHSYYLREFYLHNKLKDPDAITLAGRPIDLGKITQPGYNVATEQDHIAPWRSVFQIPAFVSGPVRGVLATSGHILGIISPPVDPPKRRYWVADATGITDPDAWREKAPKVSGSWWEDWDQWLGEGCGEWVEPPAPGGDKYEPLADAPGTYVLER